MSGTPRRVVPFVAVSVIAAILVSAFGQVLHGQGTRATGGFVDSATSVGLRPTSVGGGDPGVPAGSRPLHVSLAVFHDGRPPDQLRATAAAPTASLPVGYSYWSNINNHAGSDTMLIFLGLDRRKGGGGPTLFSYNKRTGETRTWARCLRPTALSAGAPAKAGTSARRSRMRSTSTTARACCAYDVQSRTLETVFDAQRTQLGADKYIWQMHSSNDDRVHSATLRSRHLRDARLRRLQRSHGTGDLFRHEGDFDECQIDKSGRWLVIKENVDGRNGEDNRIIDLQTGSRADLPRPNGAAGHSDLGFGYMVAEDNFNREPGAVRVGISALDMQGGQPALIPRARRARLPHVVLVVGPRPHRARQRAAGRADRAADGLREQRQPPAAAARERDRLLSAGRLADALVVAPNMTDLNASGGGSEDYSKLPKGNIDVTGEYFIWTANAGTSRLDAFIVRIPPRSNAAR